MSDEAPKEQKPAEEAKVPASPETPAGGTEQQAAPTAPKTPGAAAAPADAKKPGASKAAKDKKPHYSSAKTVAEDARVDKLSLAERMYDHQINTEKMLRITEDLMLSMVLRQEMQRSFFNSWKKDANSLHRIAIHTHKRIQKLKASDAANAGTTPSSPEAPAAPSPETPVTAATAEPAPPEVKVEEPQKAS